MQNIVPIKALHFYTNHFFVFYIMIVLTIFAQARMTMFKFPKHLMKVDQNIFYLTCSERAQNVDLTFLFTINMCILFFKKQTNKLLLS